LWKKEYFNKDFITAIVDAAERAKWLGGMPSHFCKWW
jgi:hypothetical protein